MRSMLMLLFGILTYVSLAAARCEPNNPTSCNAGEKTLLSELKVLSKSKLLERLNLERMELLQIQSNARSEMERLQSEEIALRSGGQSQNIGERRSLLLKERGQWEAEWSKKMSDLSKRQQESAHARTSMQSRMNVAGSNRNDQAKEMQKAQETHRYVAEERHKLGQERAKHQMEFSKKMQELNSGGQSSGQNFVQTLQQQLQAVSKQRAATHRETEEKMIQQRKITALVELMLRPPPVANRVPEFMIGYKPPSVGKPTAVGKPDAIFEHEGREAEL